jgi:hypothetical protein
VAADGGTLRLVVIGTAQIVAALRADELAAVSVEAVRAVGAVDGVMLRWRGCLRCWRGLLGSAGDG